MVGIAVWSAWQVWTLRTLDTQAATERAVPAAVGDAIRNDLRDLTASCLIASADDYPQVAFAARCGGRQLHPAGGLDELPARPDGIVVIVTRTPIVGGALGSELDAMPSPASGWFAYRTG